jgi:antitoxin ParD1/3/4
MPVRVSKNVSLTPELEAFVDGQVASGRYQTASEVVRAGLRLLQTEERRGRRGRPRPKPEPADAARRRDAL